MRLAREGLPVVGGALVLAAGVWLLHLWVPGARYGAWSLLGVAAFVAFFFRDPRRRPPSETGAVVSAADGRVVAVEPVEHEGFLEGPGTRVSVFLSVFDVHVNRVPFGGEVEFAERRSGHHRVAFSDSASQVNEQSVVGIRAGEHRLVVKQIVGILARRIVCHLQPGQQVRVGERFGMIRFGSRVDLLLPESAQIRVAVGDRVRAGESVMGVLL